MHNQLKVISIHRANTNEMFVYTLWFLVLLDIVKCTTLPVRMLEDLDRRANDTMEKYMRTEESILNTKTQLMKGTPAWYLGVSHEMSEAAKNLSFRALRSETMAIMVVGALNMSPKDAVILLPSATLGPTICSIVNIYAQTTTACKQMNQHYRTHTGKCNNGLHPTWGAALEAYTRLLSPDYQDGVSLPHTNLPSAHDVSINIHLRDVDLKHPYLMAITALFGQLIANDLAHTPRMVLPGNERLKCCDVEYENFHPECFPIRAENAIKCMEYSRSAPHPGIINQSCRLGPRQQINQATSFLDLSPIYGSSEETATKLRAGNGGLLKTQRRNLPMALENFDNCRSNSRALPCFFSGDSRVNEHPGIALMHILFIREHNRIAEHLRKLNLHWNDEKLYQESRRITIAEMQHITYNEFLPLLLGESNLDRYNLRLKRLGYFTGYDSRIDATLSNAAASAGLFFIAALTPKTFDIINSRTAIKSGERSLLSSFYAPQELYEAGAIDRLIYGATAGHSREPKGLNEILLKRYFHDGKTMEEPVDYSAQVIQQGRDHGIPPYTKWRLLCKLPEVKTYNDLASTMSRDNIEKLKRVYNHVDDVDLVTGALLEVPAEGSVMGPTFLCLLGRTFRNLRRGDKYWYENAMQPGTFTLQQLNEIRKSTMSKILCDNGDRLMRIQPKAFLLKDPFLNEMTDCDTYQNDAMNLTLWIEHAK